MQIDSRRMRWLTRTIILMVLGLTGGLRVAAEDPTFSQRIDGVVNAAHLGPEFPLAGDFEFQRRVYLDLIGRGPTVEETQSYLSQLASSTEGASVVRDRLIDDLLSREEFSRYYAKVLEVMFTERREVISPLLFRPLIRQWLEDKRPLNELFTEILASDGTGEQWGAAASFIVNRNAEPNLVTRDIGRIFFGRDVQCAQCHDHPSVADYEQSEYFGILSFVNRTYLFKDERRGGALFLGEKGEGLLEFASVFRPQDGKSTAQPVLPMGIAMDAEPDFVDSLDAYVVAPDKDNRAVPRYSRRQQLAVLATHRENESFNRNLANRLWANMMGMGLVHPVDMHHFDNPPISAALLRLLSDQLVACNYDLREFLRQIARSQAYQRSVLTPDLTSWSGPVGGAASLESQVETYNQSLQQIALKLDLLDEEMSEAVTHLKRAQADVAKLQLQVDEAKKQLQQWIEQRDKDVTKLKEMQANEGKETLNNQVAEFSEEVVDKANFRVEDGRNRVLALANRRLALGEFVVEARGVQRRVRKQMQALWDQKTDCQQQIERITTLQKWLTQREKNREAIASGQSDEIAAQQKLLELQQVELIESWRRSFALRRVRGLSAEQITGAMYTALGLQYAIQAKAAAEWESLHQSNPAERDDVRKRQAFMNAAVSNNMWDTVEDMAVERFALPAGSPQDGFFASVDQALTIQNAPAFQAWLKSTSGNLVERLRGIDDPDKFADQLYLSILCRPPDDQDRAMVVKLLTNHVQERQSIVEELVWGLVASAEFRFML